MPLLFSYGSLQREEVQVATFGRKLSGTPDALPGHAVTRVPVRPERAVELGITHYDNAAFTGRDKDRIAGVALQVTEKDLAKADAYEKLDGYVRLELRLASGRTAWVYVDGTGLE